MRAYKCDICGCYCDDVYKIDDDIFDVYATDKAKYGIKSRNKTEIKDICKCCYIDIKGYIHSKYLQNLERE